MLGDIIVIGCDNNIPKAISVVEAFKQSIGFYDEEVKKIIQSN